MIDPRWRHDDECSLASPCSTCLRAEEARLALCQGCGADRVTVSGLCQRCEPRQRFHLIPSERSKKCQHTHAPYSGRIPNTGVRVCTMCGAVVHHDQETSV